MKHAASCFAMLAALLLAASAFAQPQPTPMIGPPPRPTTAPAAPPARAAGPAAPAPPAAPPMDPDTLRFYLMDGSVITGKMVTKEITIETRFGTLKVPVADIRSLTPGLDSHPEVGRKITDLIDKLGSASFDEREAAKKAILEMGPSVRSQLIKFKDDPDAERRERTRAILDEFEAMADDTDDAAAAASSALQYRDALETPEFTAVGTIAPRSFELLSPYGPLTLKLADIKRGQREIAVLNVETARSVTVDGNQMLPRNLKATTIRLERGDQVTITAEGTITMTPWGNNAISGPDGQPNYGWYLPGQIASGALVGKVGNGSIIKIGSKTTFTADRSGVLSLGIAMQGNYGDQAFPGQYNVKVRIKKK